MVKCHFKSHCVEYKITVSQLKSHFLGFLFVLDARLLGLMEDSTLIPGG